MKKILLMGLVCFTFIFSQNLFAQVTFVEHNVTSSFLGAWDVDAKDINGDGYLDIVGAAFNDKILWWENDGTGKFTEHIVSEILDGPRGVRAADVNGDGYMDVLAACYATNKVKWWSNDGNQNFTEHIIDSNYGGAHTIEAKDMDLDSDIDIICSEFQGNGEIAWWENDGQENFTKHSISTRFTRCPFIQGEDIDRDGDMDILACGEASSDVLWWENDGSMNFIEHIIDDNFISAHTVFPRDVDSDGDMDIVGCAYYSNLFSWWENDGNQNFTRHNVDNLTGALWIEAIDLDSDGDNDLIGTGNPGVDWWENDGNQNFTRHHIEGNFSGGYCVIAADLDNDSDRDLIAASRNSNKINWWENGIFIYHFRAVETTGHAPLTVNFEDLSTASEPIIGWAWDFDGNGIVDSDQQNVSWTYNEPGTYIVNLTVFTASSSHQITYENYIRVFNGESAVLFDGKNGYIKCPATSSLNLNEQLTIEAWIQPYGWGKNATLGFGRILDKQKIAVYLIKESTTFNNHSLAIQLTHSDNSVSFSMTPENSIHLNEWQHIAITYNSNINEIKMYLNGIEQVLNYTKAPSGMIADHSSADLYIGNIFNNGFTFDGVIDEVRIWNMVRSREEIQAHKNHYLTGNEPGLVGYWQMNEGCGEIISDKSGNSNSGTIDQASWIQGVGLEAPTQVKDQSDLFNNKPSSFSLNQNYPNPFNSTTIIKFSLSEPAQLKLNIYDINGRLVKSISDGQIWQKGMQSIKWDGTDNYGHLVSSGVYIFKMTSSNHRDFIKVVFIK